MIYLVCHDGRKIILLEPENVDEIKNGRPARTPDGSILIAYAPDPVWMADKLLEADGDPYKTVVAMTEGAKRQERRGRKHHDPKYFKFGSKS